MNTFQCGRGLLALAALLLSLSFPARADFLYTISYDARTIDGRAYAADSFSFTVGSIINTNGTVPVPGGELYGFTFEELSTWYPNSPGRTFESGPDFTRPIGEVVALFLVTDANPDAVGTYGLIRAGLGIRDS
ncbi:MAG: hypothetical protein NTW28_26130, partial [Candidatus Solibacter sp.]|nr:hypothetical protein [Candidatus Solibacter sp.]